MKPVFEAKFRYACAAALCSLAVACGGGGDSPAGADSERQQQVGGGSQIAVQGALARLNEVRAAMGMAPLAFNGALNAAAQAHANYQFSNGFGHGETPGAPGFTGIGYGDRAAAAGYPGQLVGEDLITGNPQTEREGRVTMDILITAPGHRLILLASEFTDVGIGINPITVELGNAGSTASVSNKVMLYPYNGQTGTNTAFAPASEIPNPLPDVAITGMPLSVHAGLFNSFVLDSASLTLTASGASVALLPSPDIGHSKSAFILFPQDPMLPNTSYTFVVTLRSGTQMKTFQSTFTTGGS